MYLGRLLEFKIIKIYKMLKSFTPIDEGIHDSFIVNLECLSYDHDQFLKDSQEEHGGLATVSYFDCVLTTLIKR